MRILFRKWISLGLATLALAPMLAGGVSPAAAAAPVFYVDDPSVANGSVSCPSPVGTTIQDGVNAAPSGNATIYVCPGVYTAGASISGQPKLKLIAKGVARINAPAGYAGNLFTVDNSTNVTIQGFIIDGGSNLHAVNSSVAIGFYNGSSGSILKNTIVHWHQPNLGVAGPTDFPIYAQNSGKMKIDHNTLYDFSGNGIWVLASDPPIISHNLVTVGSGGAFSPKAILVQSVTGGAITSNSIRSDRNFHNATGGTVGITLSDAANVKVKGNNIIAVLIGLWVDSQCDYAPHGSGNQITGNKLYDNNIGVSITATDSGCAPLANNNKVISNKIYHSGLNGSIGINLGANGTAPTVNGNVINKNTIAGYITGVEIGAGVTNTDQTPKNKVLPAPPPGF